MTAYNELSKGIWSINQQFDSQALTSHQSRHIAIIVDTRKGRPEKKNALFLRLQMSHEPGMRRFLEWERLRPPISVPPWVYTMAVFADTESSEVRLESRIKIDYDGLMKGDHGVALSAESSCPFPRDNIVVPRRFQVKS